MSVNFPSGYAGCGGYNELASLGAVQFAIRDMVILRFTSSNSESLEMLNALRSASLVLLSLLTVELSAEDLWEGVRKNATEAPKGSYRFELVATEGKSSFYVNSAPPLGFATGWMLPSDKYIEDECALMFDQERWALYSRTRSTLEVHSFARRDLRVEYDVRPTSLWARSGGENSFIAHLRPFDGVAPVARTAAETRFELIYEPQGSSVARFDAQGRLVEFTVRSPNMTLDQRYTWGESPLPMVTVRKLDIPNFARLENAVIISDWSSETKLPFASVAEFIESTPFGTLIAETAPGGPNRTATRYVGGEKGEAEYRRKKAALRDREDLIKAAGPDRQPGTADDIVLPEPTPLDLLLRYDRMREAGQITEDEFKALTRGLFEKK